MKRKTILWWKGWKWEKGIKKKKKIEREWVWRCCIIADRRRWNGDIWMNMRRRKRMRIRVGIAIPSKTTTKDGRWKIFCFNFVDCVIEERRMKGRDRRTVLIKMNLIIMYQLVALITQQLVIYLIFVCAVCMLGIP